MSARTITIDILLADQTSGKLKNIQQSLLAMDKTAASLANRFKSFATSRYMATMRLIDQVTAPASRIQKILQKISTTAWRISFKIADGALAGIRKIESALMRISGKVYNVAVNVKGAALNKLNGLLGGAAMGAGMFMPMAGMMGVGFGIGNAIQSYAEFEKQMSQVQAIRQLQKNSPEMQALRQQAKDLGMQTAWTRKQVGEAQYYQALAGWSTENILKATPHMLNLASAGGIDLGRTSDIVTDTMTAFELKPTENYMNKQGKLVNATEHYIDMLAKMQASSNTDISQAGEGLKYSANVIGKMFSGKDIQTRMQATEDTLIMMALMANAGIKGSMAGTAQRAIFARMTSGNRNAFWPLQGLGIDYIDKQTGDLLLPGEIMRNISRKFKEGIDPSKLLDFAESIQGEKIHADTRRKLDSFISQTMKNQGKMGSADMAKMAAMLAGQEAMSGLLAVLMGDWDAMAQKLDDVGGTAKDMADTMLDNLAGSFTKLGSAFDAFQQDLLEGSAGNGLRGLVDSLTELFTRANKLFQDGIDLPDLGKLLADVVTRLKNKFLELDGIGSILAGGALVMGLTKIINLARSALATLKGIQTAGWASTLAGAGGAKGGALVAQKVGTMTVSAGVVNIAGKVNGSVGGGGVVGGGGSRKNNRLPDFWVTPQRQNAKAIMADYQAVKNYIRGEQASKIIPPAAPSRFAGFGSAAGSGAAFAGIFSLFDIMNTRSIGQERLAAATTPEERVQILKENRQAEWQASGGALGSIVGAAIGAGFGSLAGPLGTAIGGVVGGMLGDTIGRILGDHFGKDEKTPQGATDYFGFNGTPALQLGDSARRRAADIEESARREYSALAVLDSARRHSLDMQEKATQIQLNRFRKIDDKLGVYSPFRFGGGTVEAPEIYQSKMNVGSKDFEFKMPDISGLFDKSLGNALTTLVPSLLPFTLWDNKASAAELSPEQRATEGQVSMPQIEMPEQPLDEWFNFDGVSERLAELSAQISEGLSSALEGASEMVSQLGASITENLSVAMEGAGEIFSGIGETISSALEGASSAANAALAEIQSAFTAAKDTVQSSWAELPGFFSGIFSGLGGAASAAGSAIYAGLTSVIGSVIGAWQSAASTISGIISSIASSASSAVASAGSAVAGAIGLTAHAEGGFVTSPEIALIGERGAELVLPLTNRERSLELLNQASNILGLNSEENFSGNSSSGGGIIINLGGFNIEVRADSAQEFLASMRENIREASDQIAMQLAESIGGVHKNQPLTA